MFAPADGHAVGGLRGFIHVEGHIARTGGGEIRDADIRQPLFALCQRPVAVARHAEIEAQVPHGEVGIGLQAKLVGADAIVAHTQIVDDRGTEYFGIADAQVLSAKRGDKLGGALDRVVGPV